MRRPRLKSKFWVCNWSTSSPSCFGAVCAQAQSGQFPALGTAEDEARDDAARFIQQMNLGIADTEVGYTMRPATLFERLYIG